jgi:hypothetical protein
MKLSRDLLAKLRKAAAEDVADLKERRERAKKRYRSLSKEYRAAKRMYRKSAKEERKVDGNIS